MSKEQFIKEMDAINNDVENCKSNIILIKNMIDILKRSTASDNLAMYSMLDNIHKTISDTLEININEFNSKIKTLISEYSNISNVNKPRVKKCSASTINKSKSRKSKDTKEFGKVDKSEHFNSDVVQGNIDLTTLFNNDDE